MDISDILKRGFEAKQAGDYPTAHKLTAILLLMWQTQTATEHEDLQLAYLRSYEDLSRNDPFFDLVMIGTVSALKVSIAVPALSPLFVATIFQKRDEGCPFMYFACRMPPQGGKKTEAPGSMAHLFRDFEDEYEMLLPRVLR